MKPVVRKDFSALFAQLGEALNAYDSAYDKAGVQVVSRMKTCLAAIREGDATWIKLSNCLVEHDYDKAVEYLVDVRKYLYSSMNGLPQINSDLDKIVGVILNENLPSSVMIAEMAMEDGENLKIKAEQHLASEDLLACVSYAQKSKRCYNWILSRKESLKTMGKEKFGGGGGENEIENENGDVVTTDEASQKNIEYKDGEEKLGGDLMFRFINTFRLVEKEKLEIGFSSVKESIGVLDNIDREVKKKEGFKKGNELMKEYEKVVERDGHAIGDAVKLLDTALGVYGRFGFDEEVNYVGTLKNNLLGELALEKASGFVGTGEYQSAQPEIERSLKFFKSVGNVEKWKKINKYWLCAQGDKLLKQVSERAKRGGG